MFPKNQPVQVEVYNNGDIEYLTPLQEVNVEAFASDYQLGQNADYNQYRDWYLGNLRKQALEKAQYARAGVAPLTSEADDTDIIEGDELKDMRREFGDTIQYRHNDGFYEMHPSVLDLDSMLYKRMNKPMSGFSCINSNTSYYGSRFADMNNMHFEQVHRGFASISLDSVKPGDIVQLRRPWKAGEEGFRPFHAVMFEGFDKNGDIQTWDQHGAIDLVVPERETYLFKSQDNPNYLIPRAKTAYRFIGDSQTDTEIKKAYQAYKVRNKITE